MGTLDSNNGGICQDPTGELKDWSGGSCTATLQVVIAGGIYYFDVINTSWTVGCSFTLEVTSGTSTGPDIVSRWDGAIRTEYYVGGQISSQSFEITEQSIPIVLTFTTTVS